MTEFAIKLKCTKCGEFRDFDREPGRQVVRCATCGKRHSADSLHAVDPDEA